MRHPLFRLAVLAGALLAFAAPALAQDEPPPPHDELHDSVLSRKAADYIDAQDGGALIPKEPTLSPCITAAERAKVMSAYKTWKKIYDESVQDARAYIYIQLTLEQMNDLVEQAHAAEVNALAELGMASAKEEKAARKKWEDAKARTASVERDRDLVEASRADREQRIQLDIRDLRQARDTFQKALAAAKSACPEQGAMRASDPVSEAAVLAELNFARTQPAEYAATRLAGRGAEEARAFVAGHAALPALTIDPKLTLAASGHADEQAASGGHAHTGSDGSSPMQRMQKAGVWTSIYAEEITVDAATAGDVVRALVMDTGVAGAPHRADVFSPNLKFVGVGSAKAKDGKPLCVIDLAAAPPPP